MKTYKITEEQIKEAHGAACSQLKSKIEQWWPEVFKSKLQVGKWYKNGLLVFNLTGLKGSMCYGYGLGACQKWQDKTLFMSVNDTTPATDKEVEEILNMEYVKRGYKEGNFKCLYHDVISHNNFIENFDAEGNRYWSKYGCVFDNGKWAEIIKVEPSKEMTIEEIESKLGHKIKIVK